MGIAVNTGRVMRMANEKRLIDANANEATKIKTHFAQIIVDGTAEKPCYSILYFDPTDREYHIGFSSYCLEFVFKWLLEEFEIVEAPTIDAVEVVRCKNCAFYEENEAAHTTLCRRGLERLFARPDGYCSYGETMADFLQKKLNLPKEFQTSKCVIGVDLAHGPDKTIEVVVVKPCGNCRWKNTRHQKCSCCRRNRNLKDNYEGE